MKSAARILLAGSIGVALGAATPSPTGNKLSVQLSDAGPLQQQITAPAPVEAPQATMQRSMFQPAPTPDPDASGPDTVSNGPQTASVMPSLLSEKRVFDGEGYSYSSSQQGALNHRTQPAAGLNLSVPVQQQVGHQPISD